MYYVTGNTGAGFVNFILSNVEDLKKVYMLKHASQRFKSTILKQLITELEGKYSVEVLCSSLGEGYLDGMIVREKSIAIITDDVAPELKHIQTIDVSQAINIDGPTEKELTTNKKNYANQMEQAYEQFKTGLRIHDALEEIFIGEMNFEQADLVAEEIINDLLKNSTRKNKTAHIYRRLFGTNTPDGSVNIVPHLLDRVNNSYFIKGRAGTGKSTLMKKVLAACKEYGLDMELYHCSFDPESIDMVLVPELNFCIFDSTDPHAFYPEREGQKIVDMYEKTVKSGTDEKYASQIEKVKKNYKGYMKKGMQLLKEADTYLEKIENQYLYTTGDIERVTDKILHDYIYK